MRAKILMLSGSIKEKSLLRVAQQALSDIAVAFGHSFVMRDQQMDGQPDSYDFEESQAVLSAAPEAALRSVFEARLRISTLALPQGLVDYSLLRIPRFPGISTVSPLRPGLDAAVAAAKAALNMAGEGENLIWAAASGQSRALWEEAVKRAASPFALSVPEVVPAANVIAKPLQHPDQGHVFLADEADAALVLSLFRGLSGAGLVHSVYAGAGARVHMPGGVPGFVPGLFDAMYATVALLEDSLKLKKEAGCLRASVDNVLASGWRARDMDIAGETVGNEQIAALIGEQVELAGSLMQRFPG